MIELRGYSDEHGNRRFAKWFEGLDESAAAKVTITLSRFQANHPGARTA